MHFLPSFLAANGAWSQLPAAAQAGLMAGHPNEMQRSFLLVGRWSSRTASPGVAIQLNRWRQNSPAAPRRVAQKIATPLAAPDVLVAPPVQQQQRPSLRRALRSIQRRWRNHLG